MKNNSDKDLGTRRNISRRDFLNGVSVAIGSTLFSNSPSSWANHPHDALAHYPPSLTGMRGSHRGSFEVAHALREGYRWEASNTGETYDLVVVGAGISGLSAAHYYRESAGSKARILILDNHDDFGGHAKRNEFEVDGRHLIGYGGTQSIEGPGGYPKIAADLIKQLGVDTQRFYTAYNQDLYESLGLQRATFFNSEGFGRDYLAVGSLADERVLKDAPLSSQGKDDLARLIRDEKNYLPGMTVNERLELLKNTPYLAFLERYAGMNEEVLTYAESLTRNLWALGADALPAAAAWSGGSPGFGGMDLGFEAYQSEGREPYIFHFPDGNASLARLLVRRMIPAVAPGADMEDIVTAKFDYSHLDEESSPVRIRLGSTVVGAAHGNSNGSGQVTVSYVKDGKARAVTAGRVVMAGYHSMVPYLCPELPESQRSALSNAIRVPIVYTNVVIRNWKSFQNLGLDYAYCPGSFHNSLTLDFPVSLGKYQFPESPDQPMVLHLTRIPGKLGASPYEQFMAGRRDLLMTSFEDFERNIRDQLGRVLGAGGFDPAADITAITVNRWPHGYAYGYDPESGDVAFEPSLWPKSKRHWLRARKRYGNISFAGTDAASNAMTETAIVEAHRAIEDLKPL